jgi:hypothetical protein
MCCSQLRSHMSRFLHLKQATKKCLLKRPKLTTCGYTGWRAFSSISLSATRYSACNASLGRSGLCALPRVSLPWVSGRAPLRGLSCPSAEMVWGCPRLPVGQSPWLTCVGVSRACLVWLAFLFVLPRFFAFRRPCCWVCPSSPSVNIFRVSRARHLCLRLPAGLLNALCGSTMLPEEPGHPLNCPCFA